MRVSPMTLTDYQYNLYNDYLGQLDDNLIKYSNQNSISIQYWHIIVDESMNHNDVQMQQSYKKFVYDIYHFIPTLEMSPLTYQIGYSQQHEGTSTVATGSFTMFLIDKPLPGDLFTFYSTDDAHDSTEMFRVTNVRYMRTTKNKLKLYQLDFETAPLYKTSVDNLRINAIWYWDTENNRLISEDQYQAFSSMIDGRYELMREINKFYNREEGFYSAPSDVGFTPRPLVFLNTILKRVKKEFNDLDVKPIFGSGTAEIPIDWILRQEYWDTFTCLSQQETTQGELFNLTEILDGGCPDCPPELVQELNHYSELYLKVKELVEMLAPLITEEKMQSIECDRNCCSSSNEAFVYRCFKEATSPEQDRFSEIIQGADGKDVPMYVDFTLKYKGTVELPLWYSYQQGPVGSRYVYVGRDFNPGGQP